MTNHRRLHNLSRELRRRHDDDGERAFTWLLVALLVALIVLAVLP